MGLTLLRLLPALTKPGENERGGGEGGGRREEKKKEREKGRGGEGRRGSLPFLLSTGLH